VAGKTSHKKRKTTITQKGAFELLF